MHDYENEVDVAEVCVYIVIFSGIKVRFWIWFFSQYILDICYMFILIILENV